MKRQISNAKSKELSGHDIFAPPEDPRPRNSENGSTSQTPGKDDQVMAAQLANTMWNSLKGRLVLGRIYQGKEPPQFVALFQPMVILKGGIGSGYKKIAEEKVVDNETYSAEGIAQIRVSGTAIHNNKALQVDAVSEIFNFSQDDLLTEDLSPYVPLYKVTEGNEPCFFKTYFSWDITKSVVHGNSFQKKLSLLFGLRSESTPKSSGNGGATQRASALAALSSAFNDHHLCS